MVPYLDSEISKFKRDARGKGFMGGRLVNELSDNERDVKG